MNEHSELFQLELVTLSLIILLAGISVALGATTSQLPPMIHGSDVTATTIDTASRTISGTWTDQELNYIEQRSNRTIPADQKEVYKTIGGYPSLDMGYTVFGELVEGFDVLEKISSVQTGARDKPLHDIKMTMEIAE